MALEKPFIERYIFYPYNMLITYFNDLIYQQKGITMWQLAFYIFKIIDWRFGRIITGDTRIVPVLFNILFYLFCKFDITAVSRTISNNMSLDRISNQSKITYYIQ